MAISAFHLWPRTDPHQNKIVGDFVSEGVFGSPGKIDLYSSMAVVDDGVLIAGTLYHNWHPEDGVIEMTSYSSSKKWLTRRVIRCMFEGPFVSLGCQLVVLRVSELNKNMCGIARSFGFTEVYIPRLRGRDEGEFIFSYTDDQWRASKYYKEA